jgi:hypothetical protein
MAKAETILEWLKEAGAYAFQHEDPEEAPQLGLVIDLLIGGRTVGVSVARGSRQGFKSLTWTQIERSKSNPLPKLIDEAITRVKARASS